MYKLINSTTHTGGSRENHLEYITPEEGTATGSLKLAASSHCEESARKTLSKGPSNERLSLQALFEAVEYSRNVGKYEENRNSFGNGPIHQTAEEEVVIKEEVEEETIYDQNPQESEWRIAASEDHEGFTESATGQRYFFHSEPEKHTSPTEYLEGKSETDVFMKDDSVAAEELVETVIDEPTPGSSSFTIPYNSYPYKELTAADGAALSEEVARTSSFEEDDELAQCCLAIMKDHTYCYTDSKHTTDEKPYKCHSCGAAFGSSKNLRKHKQIHAKHYPFKCDECNAAFSQSTDLKSHKKTHKEPYKCDVCSAVFRNCRMLQKHWRTHSEEEWNGVLSKKES